MYRFLGNFWGFYTVNFYQPSGWMNESGEKRYQGDFNGDGVNDIVVLKGRSQIQTYFGNVQEGFSFSA